ncbi:hypothetical protein V4Y02_23655, partial [Escherichia coli]
EGPADTVYMVVDAISTVGQLGGGRQWGTCGRAGLSDSSRGQKPRQIQARQQRVAISGQEGTIMVTGARLEGQPEELTRRQCWRRARTV